MFKKIIKTTAIVIVLVFGCAIALLSVQLGGIRGFVVQSASMEPTIATGSLAITKSTAPNTLATNDVITFIRPDKSREFITHRIVEKFENKGATVFKTKGDHNNNQDGWLLAGGGVVGKVILTVPYLGYLLSLARTKIGIALLIVIPAIGIIVDEIITMVILIRNRKKTVLKTVPMAGVLVLVGCTTLLVKSSMAVLTNSVALVDNTFSIPDVLPSPTPSPLPSPSPSGCGGNISITVSGNGAGSSSTVQINSSCTTTTTSTNNLDITNSVNSEADTGGNTVSGNTGSSTAITTGDATSSSSITNTANRNQ